MLYMGNKWIIGRQEQKQRAWLGALQLSMGVVVGVWSGREVNGFEVCFEDRVDNVDGLDMWDEKKRS